MNYDDNWNTSGHVPGGYSSSALWQRAKQRAAAKKQSKPMPSEIEWAESQPAEWIPACLAFAYAANTKGRVVRRTLDDITEIARANGVKIGRRMLATRSKELQRRDVITRKSNWHPDSTPDNPIRDPSTWILHMRRRMPRHVIPAPPDPSDSDWEAKQNARNDAWLARNGLAGMVEDMRERVERQSPEPPF